jgi:2'-5' RNA ligase
MPSLILTVHLDSAAQARLDADRRRYFPPERNIVPAHLTLFHQLPDIEATHTTLARLALEQPAFSLLITGLLPLGRGVAYAIESPSLHQLREEMAAAFAPHLIAQDRQPFRPHVVIQNKTSPDHARATSAEIGSAFIPFSAQALGLDLWRYMEGPWSFEKTFALVG